MIGRDKNQKDYFKIIGWDNRLYYLICDGLEGNYQWIRCYDWGKVVDQFMSNDEPLEFIHSQVRTVNNETSTGVKLIKQLKRIPFSVNPRDYMRNK